MIHDLNNGQEPEWMSLAEIWERYKNDIIKRWERRSELHNGVNKSQNYYQLLAALRKYYKESEHEILASFRRSKTGWYSSYPIDWSTIFTPIEAAAWRSIRTKGRIVLYPQYPVLTYQLDFGNPGLKIGLELDGKEFHNKERDIIRDAELGQAGWSIYRITGSEMNKIDFKEIYEIEDDWQYHENEDEVIEQLRHWLLETGDGVIQAIKEVHFSPSNFRIINKHITEHYKMLCEETLYRHQSDQW